MTRKPREVKDWRPDDDKLRKRMKREGVKGLIPVIWHRPRETVRAYSDGRWVYWRQISGNVQVSAPGDKDKVERDERGRAVAL